MSCDGETRLSPQADPTGFERAWGDRFHDSLHEGKKRRHP